MKAGNTVTVFGAGFDPDFPVTLSFHFLSSAASGEFRIAMHDGSHGSVRCSDSVRIRVVDRDFDDDDDKDKDDFCQRFGICDRDDDRDRDDRDINIIVPQQAAPSGTTNIINNNTNNNNASASSSSSASASGGAGVGVGRGVPGRVPVLVRTGVDTLPVLLAGMGAILLGSVLLAAGRRKRHANTPS
ncbi:MAG: hypothetical protein M3164_06710 [Actinomycetota bacterium]|nr:hypothetical protein [Actinomycetota bacterium]